MGWIEGKLLTFTNWFWNKRHQPPPPKPAPQPSNTQNENTKKNTTKKAPAKKLLQGRKQTGM